MITIFHSTKGCTINVSNEYMEKFKELVFRATNLWPDAPAEIKEFSDKLIHGMVLQDYQSQDTSKGISEVAANIPHHCAHEWSITRTETEHSYSCKRCGDTQVVAVTPN